MKIQLDTTHIQPFVAESKVEQLTGELTGAFRALVDRSGKGSEFTGWLDLPSRISDLEINEISAVAKDLASSSEVCVVTGIGGSYLGARAIIEALKSSFGPKGGFPEIVYAGHHLSADYYSDLMAWLEHKDYSVIIISKSGTTTEPALAFRLLKSHLEKKYGKAAAAKRIIAITDRERGVLKHVADAEGYRQFVVPDDVGGRFSVLTPVGLLPIAAAGFDIQALVEGARKMQDALTGTPQLRDNIGLQYAGVRNACYREGYVTEVLVNYEPKLNYVTEWWKQLYGESEGKDQKGIFPAGVNFTTDLHSMGQYLQEGPRRLFETVLSVASSDRDIKMEMDPKDSDGLNFLAGKGMAEINRMAEIGTLLAHHEGRVPILRLQLERLDANVLGQLLYFFEFACAISGYVLGVNPFDQPGVEAYKKNMFALLGKPGYESQTLAIRKKAGSLLP